MNSIVFLLLLSSSGFAEQKLTELSTEGVQEVSVPLSPNELQVQVEAEQAQRARANAPKTALEIGVSTWRPANIQASSVLPEVSSFRRSGAPLIRLNVLSPFNDSFVFKFASGFLGMNRSATLSVAGQTQTLDQNAYLFFAGAGAEFTPTAFFGQTFKPYLSASALPSFLITSRSAFNDGGADFGTIFEGSLGLMIYLSKGFAFNIAASQHAGKNKSSDFRGFSAFAGLRAQL